MSSRIPVSEPELGEAEREALLRCFDAGWLSSEGPFVREFEDAMSSRVGRKHGIAVSSGTAAIDISVAALDIGPGDEVILPTFTIVSCVQQIVRSGATPVFVDSDERTWNASVEAIAEQLSPKTRAVLIPHIYGLTTDLDALIALAEESGVVVIEDAAEALGQEWHGRPCGSFGLVSTLSFYPNKLVTTGEGGMILTDDDQLAARMRRLRNLAFVEGPRFRHDELGWNYRLGSLQAAIGAAQLASADARLERKREIGREYLRLLSDVRGIQLPLDEWRGQTNIFWVFGLVIDESVGLAAVDVAARLLERGVETRPFFYPLHLQPALEHLQRSVGDFPVAERLASHGLYLPSGSTLRPSQQEWIASAVEDALR